MTFSKSFKIKFKLKRTSLFFNISKILFIKTKARGSPVSTLTLVNILHLSKKDDFHFQNDFDF